LKVEQLSAWLRTVCRATERFFTVCGAVSGGLTAIERPSFSMNDIASTLDKELAWYPVEPSLRLRGTTVPILAGSLSVPHECFRCCAAVPEAQNGRKWPKSELE
jgi:hypothetical protein